MCRPRRHWTALFGVSSHTSARMWWCRLRLRSRMRRWWQIGLQCRARFRPLLKVSRGRRARVTRRWSWARCRASRDRVSPDGAVIRVQAGAVAGTAGVFTAVREDTSSGSARSWGERRLWKERQKTRRRGSSEPRATGFTRSGDYHAWHD